MTGHSLQNTLGYSFQMETSSGVLSEHFKP